MAKKTILVVEDTYFNQVLLGTILSDLGYDVIHSAEGAEALQKLIMHSPDLVILDLMMPGVDGFQFLQQINNHEINIPVLVLSARCDGESMRKCKDLGAAGYITKPFDAKELGERIHSIIHG